MSFESLNNAIMIAKHIAKIKVKYGSVVVDATVGNGNDTIFLSKLIGSQGKLFGFDIQATAINNTKFKLEELKNEDQVILINDGHENISKYVSENIDFALFNLGYLPGGDHNIITQPDTTIKAIKSIIDRLNRGGAIVIVSYIRHEGGRLEFETIYDYLNKLNQKEFNVFKSEFINQINNPPVILCLEKR